MAKVLFKVENSLFTYSTDILSDGITFSKTANWESSPILNRSSPVVNYSGSGATEISIDLKIREFKKDGHSGKAVDIANAFSALVYPITPGVVPPPVCYLTIGDGSTFNKWRCVVGNVSARLFGPYDLTGRARSADINISFTEVDWRNTNAEKWARQSGSSNFSSASLAPYSRG